MYIDNKYNKLLHLRNVTGKLSKKGRTLITNLRNETGKVSKKGRTVIINLSNLTWE
jgi:hypothetical protein